MESKRKNVYITIFVITTIIASCAAVYFYLKASNNKLVENAEIKESASQTSEESIASEEKVDYKYQRVGFDSTKCLNKKDSLMSYKKMVRTNFEDKFQCYVGDDKKSVGLSIKYDFLENAFSVKLDKKKDQNVPDDLNTYFNTTINNFSDEIVDIKASIFGNSIEGLSIIFLLKNGTVEYMPVKIAAQKNEFKSYGKLGNISDIVEICEGSVTYGDALPGGFASIFAIKQDGSFYDLAEYVVE